MPRKIQTYSQMAEMASKQITGSYQSGRILSSTQAPQIHNERLILAASDATACAEYDFWNEHMKRYVRRGSRACLVIQRTIEPLYRVSDTGGKENAIPVWL